ncbi:ATP phosphoribosyltransferase regulatory subunit [Aestuariivirga litoralis]|uniref:ATP phosphoribosyltransferase regulatory subunit n=1 Tax=Aestuariivirga litoralis TaxID=2650924 RepID=UPI0018C6ED74|nr:ATP phosphoribosyltransferase regulatory subunit [Aestuariivirga litoralis]MBG1233467.1 ATP phosphoribosyltransferase regulatory subunit [Aestuariivirga litoralis]
MAGRTSQQREALSKQNTAIMAVLERAGFEQIAPDIIQPADIFLERSGEDIRARTFVFSDPDGNELCLRPDLTVPACRFHLSHAPAPEKEARYSYLGPAFRFPDERLSPQEFTQAGLEWFGAGNAVAAEARMLKLAISALEAAGLSNLKVTIGDVGLFAALLADTPMPDRWRRRLKHQFWRPSAFRTLLQSFTDGGTKARSSISAIIDTIGTQSASVASRVWLEKNDLPQQGARALSDVAARLAEKLADRSEAPLPAKAVTALESYLALEGGAEDIAAKLGNVPGAENFAAAAASFSQRLAALEEQGLNPKRFHFSANFGREIEYYTGFVFQVEAGGIAIAGGGRYDDMLSDLGASTRIPALGFAIHTERVQAVLA